MHRPDTAAPSLDRVKRTKQFGAQMAEASMSTVAATGRVTCASNTDLYQPKYFHTVVGQPAEQMANAATLSLCAVAVTVGFLRIYEKRH